MMWLLYTITGLCLPLVGDDVVRTVLGGRETILAIALKRRKIRRAFLGAQGLAAKLDPERRGLVLRTGPR